MLSFGITSFVAHNDIEPTSEWQSQIETALGTCDSLVALLHPDFHNSNWTDQEIGFVMGRSLPVFAVQLGQVPYGFIGRFQAFNGNGKLSGALARELFDAYRKHKQTQTRLGAVLIHLFERSGSYDSAKVRIGYLVEVEAWDLSYSERVSAAAENNSQIFDSWGVKDRVKALVKKWS